MLVDIESFLFNAFRNTQAMYLVQHFKDNEAHACRPHSYYGRAEELCQQEAASAAIEQPLFCSEESRKNRSQATANTVYGRCAYGVVNFQHMVDKVDCKYHYHAANGTDKYRPERRYQVTSRRDAHQSCQHTVQCEGQGRFAILHPTANRG